VSSVTDAPHGEKPVTGVSVAWGNIVLADQGRCVGGASDPTSTGPEAIGVVPPASEGSFRPSLANAPLTFAAPVPEPVTPAVAAVSPEGTPAPVIGLTSVDVDGNATAWLVTEDLLDVGIGPMTPVFVPEVETNGTAYLLFGDGVNGMQPEPGTAFTAMYRVGNGTSGNVARETIALIDLPSGLPGGIAGVTNPLPAWGGVDPETVDHVRQSAPRAFRTQQRAVTAADYQALAVGYSGVQRAAATLRWTGSWHTVFITVERDQQVALDDQFITRLEAYLGNYRMAGVDLEVEDGVQVPLLIQMSVCVQPDYVATDVQQALLAIFNAQVQPDGTPGLFNPGRLDLGQPFYLSPLIAAAQAVDGVASVQITTFERQDQPSDEGLLAGVLIPQQLEFFVLDNDPNYPERGRFDLTMEGGL
jgi:predicted phage baseplate assembly protein